MKPLFCATLFFVSMSFKTALADDWLSMLEITCQQELNYFNVRLTGTPNYSMTPPPGYVAISNGYHYKYDGTGYDIDEGSDLFAKCKFPKAYLNFEDRSRIDLEFEVRRISVHTPGHGFLGAGAWGAQFEILLNGETITTTCTGGRCYKPFTEVSYENRFLTLCVSDASEFKTYHKVATFNKKCRSGSLPLMMSNFGTNKDEKSDQ